MKIKEKEIEEYNNKLIKKVLRSALYTFFIFMLSIWGVASIVELVFNNMSVEQSNTWAILSLCIGIIFTMFFCTLTIVEEIRNKN